MTVSPDEARPCTHEVGVPYCGAPSCYGFGRANYEQGWFFRDGEWRPPEEPDPNDDEFEDVSLLVQFFRTEESAWGDKGDYENWSTERAAIELIRHLRSLLAAVPPRADPEVWCWRHQQVYQGTILKSCPLCTDERGYPHLITIRRARLGANVEPTLENGGLGEGPRADPEPGRAAVTAAMRAMADMAGDEERTIEEHLAVLFGDDVVEIEAQWASLRTILRAAYAVDFPAAACAPGREP